MGATLTFAVERDRLVFNAHVRDTYLKKMLALIAEVLSEPLFPTRELGVLKQRMSSELSLEAQDTRAQAGINLSHLLFERDHPNYLSSTEDSRADLLKYRAQIS